MSSWQQAIQADLQKNKPRKENAVVALSGNQQKNLRTGRDESDIPSWHCGTCNSECPGVYRRCDKCGFLRPDERATRMEMRAKDGEIGRGGGFFQRSGTEDHKEWNSDEEEYDEFGRKKRKATGRTGTQAGKAAMSDKQKAALDRLRQKSKSSRPSRSRSPNRR